MAESHETAGFAIAKDGESIPAYTVSFETAGFAAEPTAAEEGNPWYYYAQQS